MNKTNNDAFDAGENINVKRSSWSFKGISNEFENHINKSVPLYEQAHKLVTSLTDFFIRPNSIIIDIGCSTGNLISSISDRQNHINDINFYLIDEVSDMLKYAEKNITFNESHKYNFICKDILRFDLPKNSDIILSMFTIQFTAPSVRQQIINNIYDSLAWGGGFFFFEKINGDDARFHDILSQNYEDYKIMNGYSLEEIKTKKLSLRSILKPFSTQGNLELLQRSGFKDIQAIFQYGLFKGFLAIK